jgi:acetyl esterase/lipase
VKAVACFFPPTDFLNYGKPGNVALGDGILKDFPAPFDFADYDAKAKRFITVADRTKRVEIGKRISPVYHASADDAPTLIIHGDADELVPIQQAELMVDGLKKVGVPAKLEVRKGAGHGWMTILADMKLIADWFDEHLKSKPSAPAGGK